MSKALVEAWFEAFRVKDMSVVALAEAFTHTSPFGVVQGRQVYLDMVVANADAFFGNPLTLIDIFGEGDKFAARYLVGEMAACDCFYIRDGEIAEIYSYYHMGEVPTLS